MISPLKKKLIPLLLLTTTSAALAHTSRFRAMEIHKAPGGASVRVAYNNDWGHPNGNQRNRFVNFFVWGKMGAHVGRVDLFHDRNKPENSVWLHIDYQRLGLSPGQPLTLHGTWEASGHRWGGMPYRDSGTLTLP